MPEPTPIERPSDEALQRMRYDLTDPLFKVNTPQEIALAFIDEIIEHRAAAAHRASTSGECSGCDCTCHARPAGES